MIHKKSGFTLLEVIIGIMISAMLMTVSLTIYQNISKNGQRIQKTTKLDTQIMILHQRLSTDIAGLTPLWFNKELYEQLKKNKEDAPSATVQSTGPEKRNNFLYAQSNNKSFDILTFVTTNALQIFGDKQIRCVRVVYTLQPDQSSPNTFKLMRKEDDTVSADFNIEKLKVGNFIEIARHITSCSIEYGFIKSAKESEADTKEKKFTFVSEWGQKQTEEKQTDQMPSLPDVIKIELKVQYDPEQEEKSYELFCPIPTSHAQAIKSFAEQRKEDQEEKSKTKNDSAKEIKNVDTVNKTQVKDNQEMSVT